MGNLCIIPARGGSKRIPKKNCKFFLGKPIIAYSIETALQSGFFDEVMVSTDDEEIAQIAGSYGASIPFSRSKKNSDDFATTVEVLLEVLQEYGQRQKTFANGCCIYPTAPFVSPQLLKNGYHTFIEEKFDVLFPVVDFGYPVWRGLRREDNGKTQLIWPENETKRSQDLPKVYHDAGQFYWFNCKAAIANRSLFSNNTGTIEISDFVCQDIDTEADWKLAEIKYKYFVNHGITGE